MAKGLRSKIKRHFRTVKRETLEQAPWQVEAEKKKQEILQQILAAPRPSETAGGSDAADTAGPSGMAVDLAGGDGQQEQQGEDVAAPAAGTSNGKLLKRLRKERLLKVKGLAKGHRKRSRPLAGANQFYKTKGKKRR